MTMPLRRQDIEKAFSGLDISETQPSSSDSNRSKRDPRADRPSSTSNGIKPKPTLLTLPAEIRLRIYDLLLVSRFDRMVNPSWAVGKTCPTKALLRSTPALRRRMLEPEILRACKQIYREAIPILYSGNVFNVNTPEHMLRLMAQIGPTNIKLVKSLDMWVPWMADISPWLTLLNALSKRATGLKYIELGWGENCEHPWMLKRGAKERGLGDNVLFVRALAKIRGLEEMHITGHYAKNWPSYLKTETNAHVLAECGHPMKLDADDDPQTIKWVGESNERNLRRFEDYQKGTEDLVP